MVELVLRNEIKREKMDALLHFLKIWDVDVEIKKRSKQKKTITTFHYWQEYGKITILMPLNFGNRHGRYRNK